MFKKPYLSYLSFSKYSNTFFILALSPTNSVLSVQILIMQRDLTEFDFRSRLTSEFTAWIVIYNVPSQQYFSSLETLPPNLWDFYPTRSHEFGSFLISSSSAMEALGSPSISRAPMGGGRAFRIPRTSVCRCQVKRYYRSLTWNQFYCFRIFPKDFWPFVRFCHCFFLVFFFFFFFSFFFCESTPYEKQKHKHNNILQTGLGGRVWNPQTGIPWPRPRTVTKISILDCKTIFLTLFILGLYYEVLNIYYPPKRIFRSDL